jgi:hypothetical protein
VKVEDYLSAATVHINEEPVTRLGDSEVLGNSRGHLTDVAQNMILRLYVVEGWDMFAGNNKNVEGRGRVCIPEPYHEIIFVHFVGRQLAVHNVAKNAVRVGFTHEDGPRSLLWTRNAYGWFCALGVCFAGYCRGAYLFGDLTGRTLGLETSQEFPIAPYFLKH